MSKKALLDMAGRRATIWHEEDGKVRLETRQDVSDIIKAADIMSEEEPGKDFTRIALIPEQVMNAAMVEGWFHDKAKWTQWLNDPANACYRTWRKGTL